MRSRMPRTRLQRPTYPPVDKLKAVILERKLVMGLTYEDLAGVANVHPSYIRTMLTKKHTDDWNPEARKAICRYLGLNIRTVVEDLYELDGKDVNGK